MNLKEIEKKCPKAVKLAEKDNGLYNFFDTVHPDGSCNVRDLFDFFDDNRIFVSVIPYGHGEEITYQVFITFVVDGGSYGTRQEAETAAFTKAFEILETKLK